MGHDTGVLACSEGDCLQSQGRGSEGTSPVDAWISDTGPVRMQAAALGSRCGHVHQHQHQHQRPWNSGRTLFPTHIRSCCLRSLCPPGLEQALGISTQTHAFLPTPLSVGERPSLRAGPCSQASPSLPGSRPQGRLFCLQPLRPPCFLSNRLRFHSTF